MPKILSKRLIVIKGLLFFAIVVGGGVSIFCYCPKPIVAGLLLILIWASARSYYFIFYVLEKYVDPKLRYTGIIDLIKNLRRK